MYASKTHVDLFESDSEYNYFNPKITTEEVKVENQLFFVAQQIQNPTLKLNLSKLTVHDISGVDYDTLAKPVRHSIGTQKRKKVDLTLDDF